MIDIVTVFFPAELDLLRVQAQSLARYCNTIGIRNIYVVLNDQDGQPTEIDPTWWGALEDRVLLLPRSTFSTDYVANGWVSQQVLKLLTAAMSYNTWSMVLDAKTVFVRELALADILDSEGRMRVGSLPVYPVFEPSRQIVNSLWNIDLTRQLGPGGVPFFLHNDTVRAMITACTQHTGESFPVFFQQQGMLTEFLLYSGYVESKTWLWNKLYSATQSFSVVNVGREEVDQFDSKLAQMHNNNPLTVSVHRDAWSKLHWTQRDQYARFLHSRGLMGALAI